MSRAASRAADEGCQREDEERGEHDGAAGRQPEVVGRDQSRRHRDERHGDGDHGRLAEAPSEAEPGERGDDDHGADQQHAHHPHGHDRGERREDGEEQVQPGDGDAAGARQVLVERDREELPVEGADGGAHHGAERER